MPKIYDLIIIGAGISGLSAAYEAKKKNLSFLILDARSRIGGRIYSKKLQNGLTIELGGEWLGQTHKEILAFCKKHQIKLEPHRYKNPRYILKNGQEFTGLAELFEKFEAVIEKVKVRKIPKKLDWYSYLEKKFTEEELQILNRIFGADFATHMRYVSALDAYKELITGGNNDHMDYHVKGGNTKIVETLLKHAGKKNLKLSQEVVAIDDDKIVKVTTKTDQFHAKKVLVTTGTQMFKNIEIQPPMKEKKTLARELKYGDITKAFFSFSAPLPLKKQNFSMFTETELNLIWVATQGQSAQKFALCVYSVGPDAAKISRMKTETLWRKLKKLLPRDIFDRDKMIPSEIIVQNWGKDNYAKGAYCIFNPEEHQEIKQALGKPHGNIHFAGDYLGKTFNYINGAFQSGREVVRKITKL